MNSVELFSGSCIVSSIFKNHGYNTLTVDFNENLQPDLCIDIVDLQPNMLPEQVDLFWISIDCSTFSRLSNVTNYSSANIGYRLYDYKPISDKGIKSMQLLSKVVEILSWYPDCRFVIENPVGRLPHFAQMKNLGHYRYAVNYMDFGCGYSKETYLFTNFLLPYESKKKRVMRSGLGLKSLANSYERSKVPASLIVDILRYV